MDSQTIGSVLLASVALDDAYLENYGSRLEKLDVHHIPGWQESAARLRENACDTFTVRPDGFTAHIDAKEAGIVVFTIPYDKGFRAALDGEKTEIIPCDAAFMGVYVEPGEHTIEFTYHTRMLSLGVAMSLAAAAVLIAYVLMEKRIRRTHTAA